MVRDDFDTVLTSSAYFSTSATTEMQDREEALAAAVPTLQSWIDTASKGTELERLGMQVRRGGRQANFAPVAWIRVFAPAFSPRTSEGFYLVYLFAADGSSVYLSLNQGTSEFRSGKMRPITDAGVVAARAAEARAILDGIASPLIESGLTTLDLGVDDLDVGYESKQRARNYEAGNVVAVRYVNGGLPDDDVLRADLGQMLALLEPIYLRGAAPADEPVAGGAGTRARGAGRQGFMSNPVVKKAVELHAVGLATDLYESEGWSVEDVGAYESYDLRCTREDDELHVEVKGTTTAGTEVFLTIGEVRHAREFPGVALVVVSSIKISGNPVTPFASGGVVRRWDPWTLDETELVPTRFVYTVGDDVGGWKGPT